MPFTEGQTVADIASQSLGAVRVFEKYGIDYCCGGKRPLAESCEVLGIPVGDVVSELEQATTQAADAGRDWKTASLRELINHIVITHHEYLKLNLPLLQQRARKVASVHGERDPRLVRVAGVFDAVKQELDEHMHKEEMILFPIIGRQEAAAQRGEAVPPPPFGTIAHPIRVMEMEHDSAGEGLRQMQELTDGYQAPEYACVTYRSLLAGLKEFEADLHIHIHLENNILFPRAIEAEAATR